MPQPIKIAIPIDQIEARKQRVEQARQFGTPDRVPVIPAIITTTSNLITDTKIDIAVLTHGGQSHENERSQSTDLAGLGNSRYRWHSSKAGHCKNHPA